MSADVNKVREAVPPELRELPMWLLWRLEGNSKVPYYASKVRRHGKLDTPEDRAQLVTFDEVAAAYDPSFTGVGVALGAVPNTDVSLCGIDFDDVDGFDPLNDPRVRELVKAADSYAEVSPSGRGVKVFGTGSIGKRAPQRPRPDGLEIYSRERFFTVTGERINGAHLADLTEAAKLARSCWSAAKQRPTTGQHHATSSDRVPEGGRNQALWDEACRLHNRSTDKDAGLEALLAYNAERCDPPLSDEDVRGVCDRVWSQDRRFENTDYGNAERFVDEHRDDVRFVHEFNRWYVWDGHHWREDTRREVELLCKQTIRKMQLKAVLLDDDNRKRALIKWALASESVGRIAAAIQLARSEPGITITAADLDKDPWALVTTNAVLDLRTGKPVAARRDALLTKQAGTSYDPGATCPVWDAYLDRVMRGDKARINFLQRAVGYALTGLTTEHCVFFLYGTGANGKTTFVNTIHAMLGEYARATDTNMWVSKKHASVPDDLAALRGIRLATTTEGEDGQRLAESRIKQIAGGDVIAARKLYGDWFQFVPQLKLFFATNHKPVIMSDDHAIWRRIRLIPFEVQIPEAERDQTLQRKLLAELPGILNWALEGCLQWQAEGLQPPAAVQEAGKQYRAEQDRIGAFLDECCVVNPDQTTMTVTASALYGSYTRWCNNNGCHSLSALRFKEKLGERGLVQHKTKKANEWRGIGLLSLQQSDPPGEADPDGMDYPM